ERRLPQLRDRARNRGLAAEEHASVRSLERGEATERRALELAVPMWPLRHHALAFEPLPQAGGGLRLGVVGIDKSLIAGGVVAFATFSPALPDRLQQLVLLELFGDALGVIDDRRGLAEQEDVGNAGVLAADIDRGFEFEHSPAFVGRAV